MDYDDLTSAIMAEYECGLANHPLELCRDTILTNLGQGEIKSDAIVLLQWLPTPHTAIHFKGELKPLGSDWFKTCTINFSGLGINVPSQIIKVAGNPGDFQLVAVPLDNTSIGTTGGFTSVTFHVVNLRDFVGGQSHAFHKRVSETSTTISSAQRMILESNDWRVTLDSVEGQDKIIRSLRHSGGYAVTYVGCLERIDRSVFGLQDFDTMGQALISFLSFVNGNRCSIVLPVAHNQEGIEIWRGWNSGDRCPWLNLPNWSSRLPTDWISPAFPGFLRLWNDSSWHDAIRDSIEWYLQSQEGRTEGGLVLAQAALELLGWTQFVKASASPLSKSQFKALHASGCMLKLAQEHGIPAHVYPNLKQIQGIKDSSGNPLFADGPSAIASIRNNIIHPEKSVDDSVARQEASNLCRYYIECVLLSLFGHKKNMSFVPGGAFQR